MSRLGTPGRPAVANVHTMERAAEILKICSDHGWKAIVGIEEDKPEDISDVELLLARRGRTVVPGAPTFMPRNGPCPCGSGRKFKNCCAN